MTSITIKTNNVPRDTLGWHELTAKERKEFDYLDTEQSQDYAQFVRFKGWTYDLGEYMRCTGSEEFKAWDGHKGDSYFSGTLVRFVDDGERVVMATYYS